MTAFVKACPEEINGFGYLEQYATNELVLTDVFILEQTVTPASVVTDSRTVCRHLTEMVRQGIPTERMRFQWHSHVDFNPYYSGTDTDTIDNAYTEAPWMISMVLNKFEEFECRIDWFGDDFRLALNVDVQFIAMENRAIEAFVQQEITNKVQGLGRGLFGRKKSFSITPDEINSLTGPLKGGVKNGI
jgi:hypothetical protein